MLWKILRGYSLEDVKRDFDPKIASLIDGLTKNIRHLQ